MQLGRAPRACARTLPQELTCPRSRLLCCRRLAVQPERRPKRRAKRLHDLSDVSSVAITAHGPLDEYRFNMYMRDLLAEKAKDIFRCKGVLSVHVSSGRLPARPVVVRRCPARSCWPCALLLGGRGGVCVCAAAGWLAGWLVQL